MVSPEKRAAQQSLTELTRIVALALQDRGLRQRVKADLRSARVTVEHKIHLQRYLKGQSGGILLAKMAQASGKSRTEVEAMANALRDMEFYLPVAAHRESWTGDATLIVASQFIEEEDPVAFALDGSPVPLRNDAVPTAPTLAIVPAEADFDTPLDATFQNVRDAGGQSVGTLCDEQPMLTTTSVTTECDDDGGGGGGGGEECESPDPMVMLDPTSLECEDDGGGDGGGGGGGGGYYPPPPVVPPGTYLDFAYIDDDGESWIRGKAELQVHLIGPVAFEGNPGEPLSCTSEETASPKWFNQDGHYYARNGGAQGALFLKTDYDIYYQNYTANKPIVYQFWEEDKSDPSGVRCLIQGALTRDAILGFYENMRQVYQATSILVRILSPSIWAFDISNAIAFAGALQSEDDFVGTAVDQGQLGYAISGSTHVLMRPITYLGRFWKLDYNGHVRLVNVTQ